MHTKKGPVIAHRASRSLARILLRFQRDRRRTLSAHIVHEQRDQIALLELRDDLLEVGRRANVALLRIEHAHDDRAVLIQLAIRRPCWRDTRHQQTTTPLVAHPRLRRELRGYALKGDAKLVVA